MELKNFFAQDLQGNVIVSPTVYLYEPETTTLVTGLEDANGNPLANPFTGTANGQLQMAAPDGDYDLRVTGAGRDFTMRVRFVDASPASVQLLRDDLASTATGKGSALVGFKQSGANSVGRTAEDKFREFVSITDFAGLVSSGNWTESAMAAAESLPSGGFVYLPPGQTYRFEELPYYTGIYFVGAGKGATFVEAQSSKSIFGQASTSGPVHHCGVIGMTIRGRRSDLAFPVDDADGNAIRLNQVSEGTFRDLLIQETIFNGVSIYNNSHNNLFEDIECRDVGKSGSAPGASTYCGIFIEAGSSRNRIVRPRINVTRQYGIWIGARDADNYDNEIIDPWISGTAGDGIRIGDEATSNVCHRPKVSAPRVFSAGDVGIRVYHSGTGAVREAEIVGGHVENCVNRGILIDTKADRTRVIGTRLKSNGAYNLANAGTNSTYWVEASGATTAEVQDATTDSKRVGGSNLADGRQGSFTPQVLTGGTAVGRTYATQQGNYRVNGNRVEFNISIVMTAKGSSTGALTIGGLPFTSKSTGAFNAPNVQAAQLTYSGVPFGLILNASSAISLYAQASGAGSTILSDTALANNTEFYVSGSYEI